MPDDQQHPDRAESAGHLTPESATTQPSAGPVAGSSASGPEGGRVSRRGVFAAGLGGAALVGAAAGLAGGHAWGAASPGRPAPGASANYAFRGQHQAGIVTPAQDRLHFAAFDVSPGVTRADLVQLLKDWTDAADRLCRGEGAGPMGPTSGAYDAPPDDTGEAIGLPPSGLTITFGLGPSLFVSTDGKDRFGIAAKRPKSLQRLPHFPADLLVPERSDGDLCIQACADDPQVAVHAIRNLARIAMGTASIRWSQLGFGRTSSTSTTQATPRNLFGFKDGTANLKLEEQQLVDANVWVGDGAEQKWTVGGSYLVARRISMTIETWDRQSLQEQEKVIGRTKDVGAPLSGGEEFTEPNFTTKGQEGTPLIDVDAHVRLAHPSTNQGHQMLRRGYNFVDGTTELGTLDAGLFFIAFVVDPATHYIPMQLKLARQDLMSEYLKHTGSGLWFVPPGVKEGEHLAQALFS